MAKDLSNKNCPLKLLSRYGDKIKLHELKQIDLDECVRQYFLSPKSERHQLRDEIFFNLTPFLLKSLSWYCSFSPGCGVNCRVADLLSTAYIAFTDLIDQFDPERHLNFLGYIVNGLSWGLFNSYVKERRYNEHCILFPKEEHEAKKSTQDR